MLTTPDKLSTELRNLPPQDRKLLHSVEEVGGEVDTEELLEMEREPVRLQRRGWGDAVQTWCGLLARAPRILVPVHPNRHSIPTEVAMLVGAERLAEREELRRRIRDQVAREDYIPQRARFAYDLTPLAVGLAMAVQAGEGEIRPGVGTPKSLISKMSTRFGRSPDSIALTSALSRIAGLWGEASLSPDAPPGALRLGEVGHLLYKTWRRGAAWDESRPNGELLRVQGEAREAGAVGVVRSIVVEALQELSDGQWAPWGAFAQYLAADGRTPGLTPSLQKQAQKLGIELR